MDGRMGRWMKGWMGGWKDRFQSFPSVVVQQLVVIFVCS